MISSLKKRARRRVKELGRKLTEVFGAARQSGLERSDNQDGNLASRHWHDCRGVIVVQEAMAVLIVAERRSGVGCDRRFKLRALADR